AAADLAPIERSRATAVLLRALGAARRLAAGRADPAHAVDSGGRDLSPQPRRYLAADNRWQPRCTAGARMVRLAHVAPRAPRAPPSPAARPRSAPRNAHVTRGSRASHPRAGFAFRRVVAFQARSPDSRGSPALFGKAAAGRGQRARPRPGVNRLATA